MFHGIMEELEMITGKKRDSSVDDGVVGCGVLEQLAVSMIATSGDEKTLRVMSREEITTR